MNRYILLVFCLTVGCANQNPTASIPATGFEVYDVNQGTIGDCWLLATLAAFADEAPAELAAMVETSASRIRLPGPVYRDSDNTLFNYEVDPNRPNWPAQVEMYVATEGIHLNGNDPWSAADAFGLQAPNVTDTMPGGPLVRPTVLCTDDTTGPRPDELEIDHCYAVVGRDGKTVNLYNPHGASECSPIVEFNADFIVHAAVYEF